MKHETFSRARLEILNYVITFCTNTLYDGKYFPPFSEGSGFESVKMGGTSDWKPCTTYGSANY